MARDSQAPDLVTWSDVLSFAISLLDKADPKHFLTDVQMGTYAVGGHWCDLSFSYSYGTNLDGRRQDRAQRIDMIAKEWVEAKTRQEEIEAERARERAAG